MSAPVFIEFAKVEQMRLLPPDLIRNIKLIAKGLRKGWPAGHYYSPVPSDEDILHYFKSPRSPKWEIPGVNLNGHEQHELLNEYISLYNSVSLAKNQSPPKRYYYENDYFGYSDAFFLRSFLLKNRPKKIIEVGSGFSSAVIMDTLEDISYSSEITFIEPYPERLLRLLKEDDLKRITIIPKRVQDVQADSIIDLSSNDLLFIDSSHVIKCGSDLQFLLFNILPHLRPGVFVHFHDIFFPFDYPQDWLLSGRYWNENYFLRAFLSFNVEWSIVFFAHYMSLTCGELIRDKMPQCAKHPGGSLYLQRRRSALAED